MSPQLGWRVTALGALAALVLLAAAGWRADRNLMHAQRQTQLLEQAESAKMALANLLSSLKDAETGQRGYLLTGDKAYLQPYTMARAQIGTDFTILESSPLQDSFRQAGEARLQSLVGRKLDELGQTVALYESGESAAALAMVRTNLGQQLMDQIRAESAAEFADIDRSLAEAERRLPVESEWISVGVLICTAFMLLGWIVMQQFRINRYLATSRARLERFTHAFGMGLGMIRTTGGRIVFWSQGSERLYGYRADEAIGRISHEILHTVFPAPLAEIEAHLQSEGFWQGELIHRRRDGSELRVLSHWALHRSDDQAEDTVIEVNSDITSLARTDAMLRSILQTAPALIYAKDLQGRMLLANPPTLKLLGLPWEQVEGRTDMEMLEDREEAAVVMATDRRVMLRGRAEVVDEKVGVDETGAPQIWSSCKAPMRDGNGQTIGMVGVSVEVTAQRRVEEQLRQKAAELERAYTDMEDFAHIIAHDLRSPLRAVKFLSTSIAEDIAPLATPEILSDLALMGKRVDRMAMLLEGLLTFSTIGRDRAESEAVSIPATVAEIIEMLAPRPGLNARYVGENLTIQTQRPPLVHVLQNLISNAIKHHDRPEGEIRIAARRTERGVVFSVQDDGPGIPLTAQTRIFNIFQTLAVRPKTETSGVGLAIVRKTVESRGGKVWVESQPGVRGATFIFTWPEAAVLEPGAETQALAPVSQAN